MSTVNATKFQYKPKFAWFDSWTTLRISILFIFFAYTLNKKWDVTQMGQTIFHPERAHYSNQQFVESKSNRLCEGWYYKIASTEMQIAVIPGAYHSTNKNGNYAFIMFVTTDFCYEYRYPLEQYITGKGAINTQQQFYINIGPNNFSRNTLSLFLEPKYIHSIQPTNYINNSKPIKLELTFIDQDTGFPISLFQLGAMGYYGWIPFLECYHGILAMNFLVHGTVEIDDQMFYKYSGDNDNMIDDNKQIAHGYLEKDWGTNFPKTWVWIQANHFEKDENVSLTLALARLPILGDSVYTKPGFLGGLYLNKNVYRIGTFTWSVVKVLDITDNDEYRQIIIVIHNFWGTERLHVKAIIPNGYKMKRNDAMKVHPHLMVPQSDGYMMPTLMEWINASVWMRFEDDNKDLVFESKSFPATVECHGADDMEYMLNNFGN